MAEDGRRADGEDRGPGAAYGGFAVMEGLLEKLKLLDYEEQVLAKHNSAKSLSRHYFVSSPHIGSNPGEQFYLFTITAAWLINTAGRPFPEPLEYDEPTTTVSNILAELRAFGVKVDFPPSKLKSGSGEHVCFVLDRLAEEALKRTGFSFRRPKYPTETTEEESIVEDDAELTLSRAEEEAIEADDDEDVLDLDTLKLQTSEPEGALRADDAPESAGDAAEWNLEVERVLTQLRVSTRTHNKQWRSHLEQMHQHNQAISSLTEDSKSFLTRLQQDLSKAVEKVSSREKYISKQLEPLIQEYRSVRARLQQEQERYQQTNARVMEKRLELREISDEVKKIEQEIKDRDSSMSDGAPVVRIRRSLTRLKQEVVQMDVRTGVVQHALLLSRLKEKSNMTRDMLATNIT
ncbi:intraflagellar transport protein 57 homolog isoform X1 [Takifugu rubripes]|uniref:Intraflagellar transport protein 57 homolog n=1 Tax=Takifugu rubripes TaxID=31033 RepID=A0A674MB17_TAKRU|nr:intraflagellar transport protein 57 homolog isoform X1 [Takifugu rubripes]XP_029686791.1 intraflagellar transport protein 57 homolog isoform X1 [Takifugu rubripes]XP_029686792.1 intraflagellar transport protein 57 homolog isoform X1 [Takifugu rubripes]XP_029686794.1 intraflagellar transport protein 57 homolog isoform X1 [Takifugu rubripes]XP_029686795.1 intraflagellar transport protein 57 homolog isoform X1 [Takifugu rubripes]XP_029686796.1 intraflagellar transport protein 57 homolog isofor